jgi:CRP-like cAMP-binding protein
MLTLLEKVDILQRVPLFRGVYTESLARLAAIAEESNYEARQVLFHENDAADTMFVLVEGEVSLVRDGREAQKLVPPDAVGILALLGGGSQPESAIVAQRVRALRIDQEDFYDAMAEDFNITRGVLRALVGLGAGGH